mgnify:CR=1 FL=1
MRQALYVYCVVWSPNKPVKFEAKGISGKQVYPVYYKDLALIIHECNPIPYSSKDPKKVSEWVKKHGQIIDEVWDTFGNVLPFSFNTIIKETSKQSAFDNAISWLEEKHGVIIQKMRELDSQAEFGVQIYWDRKRACDSLLKNEPTLLNLQKEMAEKGEGAKFLFQEKLEKELRQLLEKEGLKWTDEFLNKIKGVVSQFKIEKSKEEGMILNLSCLTGKEKSELGEVLEEIKNLEEFQVRFTGPWPPYSFSSLA